MTIDQRQATASIDLADDPATAKAGFRRSGDP